MRPGLFGAQEVAEVQIHRVCREPTVAHSGLVEFHPLAVPGEWTMNEWVLFMGAFASAVIFSLGWWLNEDGKKRKGIGMFERIIAFWFILAGIGSIVLLVAVLAAMIAGVPLGEFP